MTSQRRSENTRIRILASAAACFAERGYDATGVAEICQQAGVSKGAFYHHFASKQALFAALLDDWLAALDDQVAALSSPAASSAPQSLQFMVSLLQQVFRDASGRLPMFLEFWRQAARDETIWQATMAPFERYRSLLAGIVRAGIDEGSLQPCDPDDAARVIVSMAVGMVLQSALDPAGNDWQRSAQAGLDLLLHGLARRD